MSYFIKFLSQPQEVEAVRYIGLLHTFPIKPGDVTVSDLQESQVQITTDGYWPEGRDEDIRLWVEKSGAYCNVHIGDYIIRESDGVGYYPCAKDIFEKKYTHA